MSGGHILHITYFYTYRYTHTYNLHNTIAHARPKHRDREIANREPMETPEEPEASEKHAHAQHCMPYTHDTDV
jgi:hypothetical protein